MLDEGVPFKDIWINNLSIFPNKLVEPMATKWTKFIPKK